MVKLIRFKDSPVRLRPLKSRKSDFFRINPRAISKIGKSRLIKRGLVSRDADVPADNPNRFIGANMIAHWDKTRFDDGDMHVGFTITIRTVSKRANVRNLARRRLKAAVNETIRGFGVAGHDFVFTAREPITGAAYADIVEELRHAFQLAERRIREAGAKTGRGRA